jgi:hypothetical protein
VLSDCYVLKTQTKVINLKVLRSAEWWFCTDVSEQPIRPIFKGQENFLTLEDGTDMLSRNVGAELPLDAV